MLAATSDNPEILEHLTQIDKDLLRTFPGGVCHSVSIRRCISTVCAV